MRPTLAGATLLIHLALAGCHSIDIAAWTGASPNSRVVSGSVSAVYGRVSHAFRDAGVSGGACAAIVNERGENMTVHGGKPNGQKFTLSLQQVGPGLTEVAIAWDGEPDEVVGRKILGALARE